MRRRPIGQILVEKNEISEADLQAALAEQERSGRRLGEILIEQGRTSWLALARAIAEQVLGIQSRPAQPEPVMATSAEDPVALVRAMAEQVANTPMPPEPRPIAPIPPQDSALARAMVGQVANFAPAVVAPAPTPQQKPAAPDPLEDPEVRLHSVEALLRERERAFIELVTTTETLRMKVSRLEEILEERDRELTRLRVLRVS
ncbi:hypothetical protein BH18ACT12_BH18ACT12_05290 [soil metagenome]